MEISIFLAKFWGLYLVIMGLSFMANRKSLRRMMALISDDGFLYMSGFIALIIGLLSVLAHNIWTSDWRVIITLFGWLSLLKGIMRFVAPDYVMSMGKKFAKNKAFLNISFIAIIIIGLYLTYKGFTV